MLGLRDNTTEPPRLAPDDGTTQKVLSPASLQDNGSHSASCQTFHAPTSIWAHLASISRRNRWTRSHLPKTDASKFEAFETFSHSHPLSPSFLCVHINLKLAVLRGAWVGVQSIKRFACKCPGCFGFAANCGCFITLGVSWISQFVHVCPCLSNLGLLSSELEK